MGRRSLRCLGFCCLGAGSATSPWAVSREVARALAVSAVVAIETLANHYCPDFAAEGGRILRCPPGHEDVGEVEVGLLDVYGGVSELSELPSGIGRWVALATDLAASGVLHQFASSELSQIVWSSGLLLDPKINNFPKTCRIGLWKSYYLRGATALRAEQAAYASEPTSPSFTFTHRRRKRSFSGEPGQRRPGYSSSLVTLLHSSMKSC